MPPFAHRGDTDPDQPRNVTPPKAVTGSSNRDGDGTLISDLTQTRTASHSRKIPSELGIRYT